jgi:hypothetical protein
MELYRKTRSVLVRHWIDLGRLSVVVSPSSIRLHGMLCRLPGVKTRLTSQIIDAMLRELRQKTGHNRIITDFRNWREQGGAWIPIETGEKEVEISERDARSRVIDVPADPTADKTESPNQPEQPS